MTLLSVLLAVCSPIVGHPTPVVAWQHPFLDCTNGDCHVAPSFYEDKLDGFRIYARRDGEPFLEIWDLGCWIEDDFSKRCLSSFPVQRGGSWDLEDVEIEVTAYRAFYGESEPSSPIVVCMPHVWHPGEPWN